MAQYPQFELMDFNDVRYARGATAAKVKIINSAEPDDSCWLWMTVKDLRANIKLHGPHEAFTLALAKYGEKV